MSKKTTTTKTAKTAPVSKPKYYIIMDSDMDLICQGTWDDVKEALEENWMDGDDYDNRDFVNGLTIYELGAGKKLKYIPAIPGTVEM